MTCKPIVKSFVLIASVLASGASLAGVLDMPEATELPEAQKKSLLKDMDIPAVKERDPNPEGGPRLNVKEFRIQGLEDDPDFNISKAELIKRVEAIRFDLMGEGEKTKAGYTLKELAEMADLIAQIEEESADQHVGPVEVQKLVFLIREQRRRRGITLGMIETVADTITQYYRERGFILAKAYIPQQQVRDGVVSLNIMLGKLGSVEVVNAKRINKGLLKRTFNGALDQPVTADNTEENLYLINDIPGVYAQGYFEPGDQVGDTRLKLNVTKEGWFDTSVRIDNHGAKTTGENRVYGEFVLHNPTTLGDEIQLGALRTEEDSSYGAIHYSLPIYTPRLRVKVGASQNDFVSRINFASSSAAGVEYSGSAKVTDADISYHFARGRKYNSSLGLQFSSIKTNIDLNQEEKLPVVDTKLDNISLNYHTDFLNEKSRSLHQLDIGVTSSKETDANRNTSADSGALLRDPDADFFYYNYSLLSFFKNPLAQSDLRLVVNHSLQYAGKALSSSNKFDLSGPNRARAFELNHFVADDAAHIAADIIFNTPKWLQFGGPEGSSQNGLTPFLLSDIAYGVTYPEYTSSEKSDAVLADVGIGLKLNTEWGLRGNLAWAVQVTDKINADANGITTQEKGSKNHLYLEFMYSY